MHIAVDVKELGWDAGRRLAVLAVSEVICNLERDIEHNIQEREGLLSARDQVLTLDGFSAEHELGGTIYVEA